MTLSPRAVLVRSVAAAAAAWSSDGSTIAFVWDRSAGDQDIRTINALDGSGQTDLYPTPFEQRTLTAKRTASAPEFD